MKQKLFEIRGNQIAFFPNEVWKMVGYVFSIAFPVCWLSFLVWAGMLQWVPVMVMTLTQVLVVLPFFYMGSRRVLIDGATKKVQNISSFGVSDGYSFSEIEDVIFVTQLVYNTKNSGYYKLTLQKNPYGKALRLNMAVNKNTKQYEALETIAIPFTQNLLIEYRHLHRENIPQKKSNSKLTMFRQEGSNYVSKPLKAMSLIVGLIFFVIGAFAGYSFLINANTKKEYFWMIAFIAGLVNLGLWGEKVKLNLLDNTIEKSYLGWFRKKYTYQKIIGFSTVQHVTGLGNNGIDIMLEMQVGRSIRQIKLFDKIPSRKVQPLLDELKQILKAKKDD